MMTARRSSLKALTQSSESTANVGLCSRMSWSARGTVFDTSREAAAVLAGASKAGTPALICVCGYQFCWDSAKGRRNTDGANSVGEEG